MEILSILVIGGIGLYQLNQFNKRLIEINRELRDTAQALKKRIEALEKSEVGHAEPQPSTVHQPLTTVLPGPTSEVIAEPTDLPKEPNPTTAFEQIQVKPESLRNSPIEQTYEPGPINRLFAKVKEYFSTGNTIVKVGVVLIFFGISFLLKYAIDNNMIPIELRLIASAALAVGLVRFGWTLRTKMRDYGLVLQGGGIGILILTTFVSMKSYGLISPELAFLFLISFTVATAMLAVLQDSQNLAAFGFLGGFLAPILVSTGQGQHVVLFSYYALLNLGILYVSWKKSWRGLNLIGFVFTFAISSIWGALKYQPEFYWSTQPFLILYFLIYIAIPLIFADQKTPELRGYVDGTIVFGNSILTLLLQLQLVKSIEYGGAFSALALAAFYIFLSRYLLTHKKENFRMLAEAFIAIGIVCVTVAIPLAFDGMKTSAIWALEAAGIYWVGAKQNRKPARYFSSFLILASSVAFFASPYRGTSDIIFLNTFFYSCFFMAAGAYVISYLSESYKNLLSPNESKVTIIMFVLGSLWWICGGLYEIDRFTFYNYWRHTETQVSTISNDFLLSVQIIYIMAGAFAMFNVGQRLAWNQARLFAHGFFIALVLFFLRTWSKHDHPFEGYGYIAWPAALVSYYVILYFNDKTFDTGARLFLRLGHAAALWVLTGVLVREFNWIAASYVGESSAWRLAAQSIIPIFMIRLILDKGQTLAWPIQRHHSTYMKLGIGPIVAVTWLWLMTTNWQNPGSAAPLPFVPLINPLELSHIGALFVLTQWMMKLIGSEFGGKTVQNKEVGIFLGATYFVWLNGVLCRAIHHYFDIPFQFSSLFSSVEVQVALSLFWTLLGIAMMTFSTKKQLRWLWVTGASLLAVVVVKMFLIDLSKTGTIARIISFTGVGILFLVVGYFSPIPPKSPETGSTTNV